MAGRSKAIRLKQSIVNNIDNHTASGPMKTGTVPSVGVTHYYWHNYQTFGNTKAGAPKKSYDNMVFLNINPSQTPVPAGFRQSTNYNYNYTNYPGLPQGYALVKYHNHYYRPYNFYRPFIDGS
jgi:hypothetical protein